MEFRQLSKVIESFRKDRPTRDESGIALFMVISSMMVLSLLVTEFTYVVGVNQRMAYDGLDSLKAHYLAKSAFKISLLRLKAYQQLQSLSGSNSSGNSASAQGGGAGGLAGQIQIPRKLLDQIWAFPFFYPIPKNIPNMALADKEKLEKFEKSSSLEGKFVATIQSESGRFNLNSILPPLSVPTPTPTPRPSNSRGQNPPTTGSSTSTAIEPYDPQKARQSLRDFLANLIERKSQSDEEFAREYRGYRIDDLIQQIVTWADITSQERGYPSSAEIQPKQAPFYSVSELHMIPDLNDELYDLFAPNLTTGLTQGINVNTLTTQLLAGLIPSMTQEELDDFIKYRDDSDEDHQFKSTDDFFKYLSEHVAAFKGSGSSIDDLKKSLAQRGIQLLVNESVFKITVQAQVNSANRILEAYVILGDKSSGTGNPADSSQQNSRFGSNNAAAPAPGQAASSPQQNSGLRVTFMRFL